MRAVITAFLFLSLFVHVSILRGQEEEPVPEEPTPPEEVSPVEAPSVEPTIPTPAPVGPPGTIPGMTPTPATRPTTAPVSRVTSGDELVTFTWQDEQLKEIIKTVAQMTGRNFIIQTPISGTVLTYFPEKIPAKTAIDVLGIALDLNGYTMVVRDDPPVILVAKKATVAPVPTEVQVEEEGAAPGEKHELATLIALLRYVSVDDMQDILRNFKSTTCVMTAYPAGNFLIIKDDEANLKYLLEIIKRIDTPGTATKITMKELKYADATETASLLTELLAAREGGRVTGARGQPPTPPTVPGRPPTAPMAVSPTIVGTATPLKIMADLRTNRLIVLASERDTEYILKLVERIDVEPTEEMYPIRTYVAQYQDAGDLADTLAAFVSGQPRAGAARERTYAGRTRRTAETARAAVPGQPAAAAPTQRGPVAGGTEEAFFLADPATNMVLVQAPPQKLAMYMDLLRTLDQPQKQVLIEVWVVEVSSKSQLDIGVEFQSAEIAPGASGRIGPMQDEIFGGSNFDLGLGNLLSGTGFASSGILMGIRSLTNTKIDVGGKIYYLPSFDTFIRALREDTNFNILSSPKLLTLNNETASVDVSDEISIAESSITSFSTAQEQAFLPGGVTETYRRTDVGINLQITPQINSANSVIMEIDLMVGSIAGVEDIQQAGSRPVIANRSTITRVRVDNERTIVISGLRRADRTKTVSRVPLLGQIPILGLLFSHDKTLTVNTNLLIFITPHIVSDTLDMLEVTDALKNQDLEKERPRFQAVKKSRKQASLKAGQPSSWDWKK